jgi:rhamnosyltransferase subunit B
MSRRILFATWGSLGDLHPFLAVALGLRARGHQVTVASAAYHRAKVEAEGLAFHPLRPDLTPAFEDKEVMRRVNKLRGGTQYLVRGILMPHLRETYQDLETACDHTDVMVGHGFVFACPLVAEKLEIPWLTVVLQPALLFSMYDPPILPAFPALRFLGPGRHSAAALEFAIMRKKTRSWVESVGELRRELGLRPARRHPLMQGMFSPSGTLAWFSPVLASPQPDWPPHTEITGYPVYDCEDPGQGLEPPLAEFIARGDAPIVFTLGSTAVHDAGDFYRQSLQAACELGHRAVLLTGQEPRIGLDSPLPETAFATAYAPYSKLFQHAAAIVHQGGIGTLMQALAAGRPMLVIPYSNDQPDNAERAQRLGVARVLPRRRYAARRAASELSKLLRDPAYRAAAARAAEKIRSEDAVNRACDMIERFLKGNR